MGLKETLHNKDVYFDTNIFIYLLEDSKVFSTQLVEIKHSFEFTAPKKASSTCIKNYIPLECTHLT